MIDQSTFAGMDFKKVLERVNQQFAEFTDYLFGLFTQLNSEHPLELGIGIGAFGMAVIWLLVSRLPSRRTVIIDRDNYGGHKVGDLDIGTVRQRARRRL